MSQKHIDQLEAEMCLIARKIMLIGGESTYGVNALFEGGRVLEIRLEARMKKPGETFDTEVKVADVAA